MSAAPTPPSKRNILVFASAAAGDETLLSRLRECGVLRAAQTLDEALAALRTGTCDLVLASPADLFPLARVEARQRAELILEQLGQGVCIVDRRTALVWSNARFRAYPEAVVDTIRQECGRLCAEFAVGSTGAGLMANRRRTVRVGQEYVFDLTVAPLMTADKHVEEVVGLVQDVTATYRLQEKIDTLDAAGGELVRLDADALAQMDVGERLRLLDENINRFARDLLNFDHFVVRVLDKKTKQLDVLVSSGLPEEADSLVIYADPEGNGISGYVAATGRSYICPDVSQDPRYLPGLERAGSSLTVPLLLNDQVVGVFNVESHQLDAFTEDDRQFCEIFGRYVAIALNILQLLVVERSATTGQVAADVATELAIPLNDIVAAATRIIEEHPGQDALHRRLHEIIASVDRAKRSLQTLPQSQAIRGLIPEKPVRDELVDGRRILVAEDEDIIRETIADVLTKNGALTVMARDGEEAVAMIRAQHFDVVISDIKMPYKNGYEVFAAARQTHGECPVILITGFGYDPEHSIVRASKEGLAAVLFKPFKVDELMAAVHTALGARKN